MISATAAILQLLCESSMFVFGRPDSWVVINHEGTVVRRFAKFDQLSATDVAVSPDGKGIVFTAREAADTPQLLFRWNESEHRPILLGEPEGYHDSPSFSEDGRWVYFVHHGNGGPPGTHAAGAYAQVMRIAMAGGRAQALTRSKGCHLRPQGVAAGVFFGHADCGGAIALEWLAKASSKPVVVFPLANATGVAAISPTGNTFAVTSTEGLRTRISEVERRSGRMLHTCEVSIDGKNNRLQLVSTSMLYYQDFQSVFALNLAECSLAELVAFGRKDGSL